MIKRNKSQSRFCCTFFSTKVVYEFIILEYILSVKRFLESYLPNKGEFSMGLYERIKQCADEKKISITNLEKAVGFSNGTIGKWKNSEPKASTLYKVASYFGKSIEYFLIGETGMMRNNHNVLTNSINESDNATLIINQEKGDFSKQELELIATYRSLNIRKQAEMIQYLLRLQSEESE